MRFFLPGAAGSIPAPAPSVNSPKQSNRIFRVACRCYPESLHCGSRQEAEHDSGLFPLLQHARGIDRYAAAVDDLAEARDHAALVVRLLISAPSAEDWRGWVMHVSDDLGDEIFDMPFAAVLGRLH